MEPSLASGFLWQGAKVRPSYRHRRLSSHSDTDTPNPGVMACHIWKRTQANSLYLPENLIS